MIAADPADPELLGRAGRDRADRAIIAHEEASEALDQINGEHAQRAFVMDAAGMTHAEIAEALGLANAEAVDNVLAWQRRRLRQRGRSGMTTTGHDDPHDENTHLAALIERSSLGTREGRLRRSTVSASTGRAIARSAIARSAKSGRYASAATAARHPRTAITKSGRPSGGESPHNPKGSAPSDDLQGTSRSNPERPNPRRNP